MKYKRRRRISVIVLGLLIGGTLLGTGCKIIKDREVDKAKEEKIAKGVTVLQSLEKKDVAEIENKIKNMNSENDVKESTADNSSLKEVFKDTVFMGDSLTEPLSFYNILNEDSVIGIKGRDVIKAKKEDLGTLKSLNPKKIVMMYGMNDLLLFSNSKDFIKNYESLINEIKRELPSAEIYVNSVFPVSSNAIAKKKEFSKVNDFNNALREMCNTKGIKFIDTTSMVKENMYEPDGIHLKSEFYTPWLQVIKKEIGL
ncbi:hypothetical protein QYB59_000160 [Clostridium perfringens]|nr:hypothetical protein [Clostridium perfringens]